MVILANQGMIDEVPHMTRHNRVGMARFICLLQNHMTNLPMLVMTVNTTQQKPIIQHILR